MFSILEDVRHMSHLTQTLLEFAKASGTAGGLEIEPIRIDEVLFRLPAEIAKTNKAYSVSFEFDELPAQEEQLLVSGNEELLFTAIKNIVINACKYSFNQQAVIRLSIQYPAIIIQVQDSGPGIPENEIANIFQPFYRIHSVEATGFGLGLPLASRIIKLHKGTIEVVSTVNNGSVFTIRFESGK
jgi:signal transduction histidine kinase